MTESARSGLGVAGAEPDRVFRKVAWRLSPLLFICYIAAYVDRTNIGFAKAQIEADLGFSDLVYGLGAGIFFIGYFLFEVPSNLWMTRIGARRTLTRIMILWGLITAATMFVTEPWQFYVMRFLLGAAEAGFAPGVILFLTAWFPSVWRARMLSLFLIAVPVSGMIGGPLAGWILTGLDESGGLHGWQWLLLLEGLFPVALGLVVMRVLTDGPHEATWLDDRERALVVRELEGDPEARVTRHLSFLHALRDARIWVFSFVYFTISAGVFLIAFWLPTLLNDLGELSELDVGLLYAVPYTVALVVMLVVSAHSDRTKERGWHLTACGLIGAGALISTTMLDTLWLSVGLFSIATAGIITMMPIFWTLPPRIFAGVAGAGAIAVINSLGTLSGFVSPYLAALIKTMTGTSAAAVVVIGLFLVVGTVVGLVLERRLPQAR